MSVVLAPRATGSPTWSRSHASHGLIIPPQRGHSVGNRCCHLFRNSRQISEDTGVPFIARCALPTAPNILPSIAVVETQLRARLHQSPQVIGVPVWFIGSPWFL